MVGRDRVSIRKFGESKMTHVTVITGINTQVTSVVWVRIVR